MGSSSNSILPTVNGKTDYFREPSEFDTHSPGTFVRSFDQGTINVANGKLNAKFVRSDIRVSVSILLSSSRQALVMTSVNVYMLFRSDCLLYNERVKKALGNSFGDIKFITHSTHNHHGPDTAGITPLFPVSLRYFEYMLDVMVRTAVQASRRLQPVNLFFAERPFAFGMSDSRDPRIFDPVLRVLQARSKDNRRVITTIAQWSAHPEVTLGFNSNATAEQCREMNQEPGCSSNGRYFSGDFPQQVTKFLQKEYGNEHEFVYFSGSLGVLITPFGDVWEVNEEYPITGDGSKVPTGAKVIPKNFRKEYVMGREISNSIVKLMKSTNNILPPREFDYRKKEFYTGAHSVAFRFGYALLRLGGLPQIGYEKRELYHCSNITNPSDENCKSDEFKNVFSPVGIPIRAGEFIKTEVNVVDFGEGLKWVTIPGEINPETVYGLPDDFLTNTSKYYKNPDTHAYGEDYKLPKSIKELINCKSCWTLGLTHDELGYIVPISDFRVNCNFGDEICNSLPLSFPKANAMSGEDCKFIIDHEQRARERYGNSFNQLKFICQFGIIKQARNHYEETLSIGWDILGHINKAVSEIMNIKDDSLEKFHFEKN